MAASSRVPAHCRTQHTAQHTQHAQTGRQASTLLFQTTRGWWCGRQAVLCCAVLTKCTCPSKMFCCAIVGAMVCAVACTMLYDVMCCAMACTCPMKMVSVRVIRGSPKGITRAGPWAAAAAAGHTDAVSHTCWCHSACHIWLGVQRARNGAEYGMQLLLLHAFMSLT